jgi:hypothetical protein
VYLREVVEIDMPDMDEEFTTSMTVGIYILPVRREEI